MKKIYTCLLAFAALMFVSGCGSPEPEFRPDIRPGVRDADRTPDIDPADAPPMPDAVRLTEGISYDSSPAWAPDGTKIAYASYNRGAQNIMALNLDYHADRISVIGASEQLTEGEFTDRDPSWSTEGGRIVFSSDRAGDFKLFTINFPAGELTELSIEGLQPRWSPAGDRIAFVYKNNISVIKLNDEPEQVMITTGGYNEFPSWSPDGSSIAFSSGYNIVRASDSGRERRSLTATAWNSQADWCRSRDRIVFASNRGGEYNLWKMNADGSNKVQLTDTSNFERFPRWSHDGRWIAFQADYEGSFDIWAIRVD